MYTHTSLSASSQSGLWKFLILPEFSTAISSNQQPLDCKEMLNLCSNLGTKWAEIAGACYLNQLIKWTWSDAPTPANKDICVCDAPGPLAPTEMLTREAPANPHWAHRPWEISHPLYLHHSWEHPLCLVTMRNCCNSSLSDLGACPRPHSRSQVQNICRPSRAPQFNSLRVQMEPWISYSQRLITGHNYQELIFGAKRDTNWSMGETWEGT